MIHQAKYLYMLLIASILLSGGLSDVIPLGPSALVIPLGPSALVIDQITRISLGYGRPGRQGNDDAFEPSLSSTGQFLAFASNSRNLVLNDLNDASDIFLLNRLTGQLVRVSVDSAGGESNGDSFQTALSADGNLVAFVSVADNLVAGDANAEQDIFVHDRSTQITTRVNVASNGGESNHLSLYPALSASGRFVVFSSDASNLVAGDTNGVRDIFVHDRSNGQTTRASVNSGGAEGNDESDLPTISADGRFVAFASHASNLVPGDTNDRARIFSFTTATPANSLGSTWGQPACRARGF